MHPPDASPNWLDFRAGARQITLFKANVVHSSANFALSFKSHLVDANLGAGFFSEPQTFNVKIKSKLCVKADFTTPSFTIVSTNAVAALVSTIVKDFTDTTISFNDQDNLLSESGAEATEKCGTRTYSLVDGANNPIAESVWITLEEVVGSPKQVKIHIKPRNTINKKHTDIYLQIKSVEYPHADTTVKVPFLVEVRGACALLDYIIPSGASITPLSYTIGGAVDQVKDVKLYRFDQGLCRFPETLKVTDDTGAAMPPWLLLTDITLTLQNGFAGFDGLDSKVYKLQL